MACWSIVLAAERDVHRTELLDAMDSERFTTLLALFESELSNLPELASSPSLGEIAAAELRKLRRDAARLPKVPADDELHDLRKRAKRARYAAELAALEGGRPVERLVDSLKALQDVIGEHQDAVVAEARLRAIARAKTAIAAGRLIEGERERRDRARAGLPGVRDDRPRARQEGVLGRDAALGELEHGAVAEPCAHHLHRRRPGAAGAPRGSLRPAASVPTRWGFRS